MGHGWEGWPGSGGGWSAVWMVWSAWVCLGWGFNLLATGKGSGYSFMIPPIIRRCDFYIYIKIRAIQNWEVRV
ncbi:hypothetical protein EYC84_005474 [Monilinia fructicola]|uniref:Uncharacterized protein n=1 Tax=Monilinia fructicola TaxID=38448 RepID=A0A5M9K0G5_MONFR|nr:hypothetical protein EYC84_005474 [Monilinia fructicola]